MKTYFSGMGSKCDILLLDNEWIEKTYRAKTQLLQGKLNLIKKNKNKNKIGRSKFEKGAAGYG